MKIILFQGNPGKEYENTRHNIAFKLADQISNQQGISFLTKSKFKAELCEFNFRNEKVLLVKPQTFYNETGFTARTLCDFYKINQKKDLLVIHDDLSLNFGVVRTRQKGSSAGNNGLKSIISAMGDEFCRIKIGISNDLLPRIGQVDFVLSKLSLKELEQLPEVFDICEEFINSFLENKFDNTKKSVEIK